MSNQHILLIITLALIVATSLAFRQVTQSDFINFDDTQYVKENRQIQDGLTLEAIKWAFATGHASNWHPLTWISHMLDVQLFGLRPGWHHLTNLLFHLANTVLLFLVLHRMTRALWQCAFVAALFALHPLHVESVAWVAERKDVLSTFFWMLTMGAYVSYAERPGIGRYVAVIVCYALGLMAKPMLVTLPFVLLLLDYWPLQRMELKKASQGPEKTLSKSKKRTKGNTPAVNEPDPPAAFQWPLVRPILAEKIPLFVLALASSTVTFLVQQHGGAVESIDTLPLSARLANAFVSYVSYIVKMVCPTDLTVFYPHPGFWPVWMVMGSIALLIAGTAIAIRGAKRHPYAVVGWLWYMGTLVPVVGIVQVGMQAMADRYTYIPLVGLFILLAWIGPELLRNWRHRKEVLIAASALCLLCLFLLTYRQVSYWRDSISLFDHALRITDRNSVIYNNRGVAYNDLDNYTQAIADFDKAIEINPRYWKVFNNRGNAHKELANYNQAISDYDKAIEINPRCAEAHKNRGALYGSLGDLPQAMADLNKAIEINPKYATAYLQRGAVYIKVGNRERAIADMRTAAQLGHEKAKDFLRSQGIGW